MKCSWLFLLCLGNPLAFGQEHQPIRYESCGETFQLTRSPQRAITLDINTTEIMLSLGLAPQMIAIAGVSDRKDVLPELRSGFDKIPKIDASYPGLDPIVGKRPDFIFGGWQYGFSESSGLTPKRLGKFGINTYALAESCIRIQPRTKVSMDDVFYDIRTIGHIFGRSAQAEALIDSYRKKIAGFPSKPRPGHRIKAFLYDGGEASPYTAGGFAIPQAMMDAADIGNIFADVKNSWTTVSWESVIARQPEFIIIVDYGEKSAEEKIRILDKKFSKTPLNVMRLKRYVVLPYAAVTPGIRTVDATDVLIKAIDRHFPRTGT